MLFNLSFAGFVTVKKRCCFQLAIASCALLVASVAQAVSVGDLAPDCTLSSMTNGQNSTLSQFKGKIIYVDFWASWCGPCAQSFPFLNSLHKQFKDQGVQIVGVNMDEERADANAFLAKLPADFTVMADDSKHCAEAFAVEAMPSSYIIDRQGKVQHIHLGFRDGAAEELRASIELLLHTK